MATKSTMGHSSGKSSLDSSIRRKSGNDKEFPLPKSVPCLIGSGEAVEHRGLQSRPRRRRLVYLYHGQWSACIMEGDGDALPCLKRRPLPRNDRGTSTKTGGQVGVLLGTRMYDDAPVLQKGFYQVGAVRAGPAPQVQEMPRAVAYLAFSSCAGEIATGGGGFIRPSAKNPREIEWCCAKFGSKKKGRAHATMPVGPNIDGLCKLCEDQNSSSWH